MSIVKFINIKLIVKRPPL
uniref:Uncharacterized protein n=1 Tax=Romanomermis culicivorax TaxID=13658 RepID=A0A915K5I6_ROMCU